MSSVKSDEEKNCSNSVKSGTSSSDFSEENYRQVFHDIIVRNVPLDLKDERIEEELRKRRDVKSLFRIKNKVDGGPTTTYRIRLRTADAKSHLLLNGIQIHGKHYKCEKFHHARIIRCFRCQQFGHAIEDCKSPTAICPKCTGKHRANECHESVPSCVNCRGNHAAFDPECPAWVAYVEGRNVVLPQRHLVRDTIDEIPEFRPRMEFRREAPEFRPREAPEFRPRPQYREIVKENLCKPKEPSPVIVTAQAITKQDLEELMDTIKEHITDEMETFKTSVMSTLHETLDQIRIEVFNNQPQYNDSGHGTQPYNSPQSSLYSDLSTSTVAPPMASSTTAPVQHGCTFYSYRPNEPYMAPPTVEVPPLPVAEYPQDMPYQTNFYPQRCTGCYQPNHTDRRLDLEEIRAELMKVNEAFFEKIKFAMK